MNFYNLNYTLLVRKIFLEIFFCLETSVNIWVIILDSKINRWIYCTSEKVMVGLGKKKII